MIEWFGFQLGTPFQGGTFVAMLVILGIIVRAYIIGIPAREKVASDREANLLHERAEEMASMRDRIAKLEAQQKEKDDAHAEEIKALEDAQAAKNAYHDALRALDRHRINNLSGSFQALLLLLKKGVAVEEAVESIEAMRAEQLQREAKESATIRAAAINAGVEEAKQAGNGK
jgi:hypothetical protein